MHNHERWKTSIPDSKFRTTCHKLKNFYSISTQNIPVSGMKCRVSRSAWGNGHCIIRQTPEITWIFSALFESRGNFSSEMRIKCIRKSLSFDSGKESSFQLCYSPFRNEKGILLQKKFEPRLFIGSLLGSRRSAIGQSFSLSLVTIPKVFAKVNSAEFPYSFVSPV